jgi:hypothetical protein
MVRLLWLRPTLISAHRGASAAEQIGRSDFGAPRPLTKPEQLICLFPTDEFKAASMKRRGKGHFGGGVSDPERAADNLRRRDRLIADRLRSEAQSLGVDVIEMDGSISIDDLATAIGLRFGLQ